MSQRVEQHPYSLQIQLLEHGGQCQPLIWHWPVDAQGGVTLADVLQELPDIDEVSLNHSQDCKIELAYTSAMTVWSLTNFSVEMICLHNGQILPMGQSVRLSHADDIEFGFTHLRISLAETSASNQSISDINDSQSLLAIVHTHVGAGIHVDNMSDASIEPGMQDVALLGTAESAQESAAALAELVPAHHVGIMFNEETQRQGYERGNFSELFLHNANTDDLSLILPTVVNESESLSDLIEKKNPSSEFGDLIEQLHQRYLARLRNPYAVNEMDLGSLQEQPVDQRRSHDDEFSHLCDLGHTGDIHELLTGKETTLKLMAHFDQLGYSDILNAESFDSVMHLFAPDDLKIIATTTQSSIPNLTRLEHHSIAIDSNMDSLAVTGKLSHVENVEGQ